jgi:hypothetical protein
MKLKSCFRDLCFHRDVSVCSSETGRNAANRPEANDGAGSNHVMLRHGRVRSGISM